MNKSQAYMINQQLLQAWRQYTDTIQQLRKQRLNFIKQADENYRQRKIAEIRRSQLGQ